MSLLDEMAEDVRSITPDEDKLGELGELLRQRQELVDRVQEAEEALEHFRELLNVVETRKIPDLFDELGMSEVTLADGRKVTVKPEYYASITKEHFPAAKAWLQERGHDSIVKSEVVLRFGRGEHEQLAKVKKTLEALRQAFSEKEAIHPATLKSFVREQKEAGADLPDDVFGVYLERVTKVK
jgi:hypothetical protein